MTTTNGNQEHDEQEHDEQEHDEQEHGAPAVRLRAKDNTKTTPMGRLYGVCSIVAWLMVIGVVLVLTLEVMIFVDHNAACVTSSCTEHALNGAFAGTGDVFSLFVAVFIISRTARYVIGPRP